MLMTSIAIGMLKKFRCKEERKTTMSKDDDKVIEAMVKYVLTGRWNKKVLGEKPVR